MRLPGMGRLRRWTMQAFSPFFSTGIILLYHRVREPHSDPQLLRVSPKHFAEHLKLIREMGCALSLPRLVHRLKAGELPRRAVAVTLDDGYADNLHQAKPLLELYGIPATAFVASGHAGQEREFWWDELEGLLLQPGRLPETLCLDLNGLHHRWTLGTAADYGIHDYERYAGWNVCRKDDPTPRQGLYRCLCRLMHSLPGTERRRIMDGLLEWAGAKPVVRPTHRVLSRREIVQLADGPWVGVGAHTVTHSILSALPPAAQRDEIRKNKIFLEDILGRPVSGFSYPYGSRADYTSETTSIVRETGFDYACSNFPGFIWRGSDPYQLPRISVKDWDGDEFASRLREWFHG